MVSKEGGANCGERGDVAIDALLPNACDVVESLKASESTDEGVAAAIELGRCWSLNSFKGVSRDVLSSKGSTNVASDDNEPADMEERVVPVSLPNGGSVGDKDVASAKPPVGDAGDASDKADGGALISNKLGSAVDRKEGNGLLGRVPEIVLREGEIEFVAVSVAASAVVREGGIAHGIRSLDGTSVLAPEDHAEAMAGSLGG
mgnify:FL=1